MAEKYLVRLGDDDVSIELRRENGTTYLKHESWDDWRVATLERVGDSSLYLLMLDNRPTELYLERRRGGALVTIGRHQFNLDVGPWRPVSRREKRGPQVAGVVTLTAPMTGSIVELRCEVGQQVNQGDVLLVMESMKMNNELRSPAAGVVETIGVQPGQKVMANALLVAVRTGEESISS
ncbi:MAG: acetyl-CoA carboxylase biotin carboxyl carrier protein subunit [Hyphomicrobiales bacterium]